MADWWQTVQGEAFVYLVILNCLEVTLHVKTGQSNHSGSQIETDRQDARCSVRVEERQQADVDFLVIFCEIFNKSLLFSISF